MTPFSVEMLYDHPHLTPASVVLEIGVFSEPAWLLQMARKYECRIYGFEPVLDFQIAALAKLAEHSRQLKAWVRICTYGIAANTGEDVFTIKGSMTGPYADQGPKQTVMLRTMQDALAHEGITSDIALLAINCEGSEYEILENLLDTGLINRIEKIMVQFHPVFADCAARRDAIRGRFKATHEEIACEPFCWEIHQRKAQP